MILEEVARQISGASCAPGISNIQKIFKREYLENHADSVPEFSDFVLGEHDNRGDSTPNSES